MRDLILEVKAEAEKELLLAQAKVEVATTLLKRVEAREMRVVCDDTVGADECVSVVTENNDGEFEAV